MRIEDQKPSLRMRVGRVILWLGIGGLIFASLSLVSSYAWWFADWTGLSSRQVRDDAGDLVAYYPAKTLWDWFELLLIPAVLTGGGILFTRAENHQSREIEAQRLAENRKIEEERLKEARELEQSRVQDAIVKDYLDQMTELLLLHGLRTSSESDEVRSVARTRTLTALRGLDDGVRKGTIVQFLYESHLIGYLEGDKRVDAIVRLPRANLEGVNLSNSDLRGVDFGATHLAGADLSNCSLRMARFDMACLKRCTFTMAHLKEADFNTTDLSGSDFSGADLREVDLSISIVKECTFKVANLFKANLMNSTFEKADLRGTKLVGAYVNATDFTDAQLEEIRHGEVAQILRATVVGAKAKQKHFIETDLTHCVGITLEQLCKAKALHGAILPDYINPADLGDKWSPPKDPNTPEPQP